MQVYAAVEHGFWYARSADFMQQPLMQTIIWMRMPGDILFAAGALMLALFVARLFIGKARPAAVPAAAATATRRRLSSHTARTRGGRLRGPPSFHRRHEVNSDTVHRWQGPHCHPAPAACSSAGMAILMASSLWWGLHLMARQSGAPLFALDLKLAPIWAHTFLMLFTVYPAFFFGFLFTVFPRWMDGPPVARGAYVATACCCCRGHGRLARRRPRGPATLLLAACWPSPDWPADCVALMRVLLDAQQVVAHAYVVLHRGRGRYRGRRGIRLRARGRQRLRAAFCRAHGTVGLHAAGLLRRLPPHGPVLFAERDPGLRGLAAPLDAGRRRGARLCATAARNRGRAAATVFSTLRCSR